MAMPAGTVARSRNACHRFFRSRLTRRGASSLSLLARGGAFLAVIVLALALAPDRAAAMPEVGPAGAAVSQESVPLPEGPADFDTCVRIALQKSPFLIKSALEIDIKKLDETDSRYGMIPSVSFRTSYYLNRPTRSDLNPQPYSLSFISEQYNPFESYFTIQARKIITQIAVLSHLQVISEGLYRLGRMMLELDALKKVALQQEELVDLARQNLDYAEKRLAMGTGTSLEARLAAQELEMARAEKERIAAGQKKALQNIKAFIGLKPPQGLELNLREARRQVLGTFEPEATTLEQVRSRSNELKGYALKKELQGYSITMAKTQMLPTFFVGAQNPDPLSLTEAKGIFFSVGLQVPVWDGFKRLRNVSRQKVILRQFTAELEEKELDLASKWQAALDDLHYVAAARKMAQGQEELARLKERQSDIRYHSGGVPFSSWVEGRKTNLEAQKNGVLKSLDYDLSVLSLRQLSGDLGYSYVDASSYQK